MITEPWIIGSLWDCLSLEQENAGCLKIWIRVSELNRTSADMPVPGREAGRQELTWQDCHGLWGQQAQCWSRCWPGLPPFNPNVLSVWWKRAWAFPQGTFFSFFSIWCFICLFQGCYLSFVDVSLNGKSAIFAPWMNLNNILKDEKVLSGFTYLLNQN